MSEECCGPTSSLDTTRAVNTKQVMARSLAAHGDQCFNGVVADGWDGVLNKNRVWWCHDINIKDVALTRLENVVFGSSWEQAVGQMYWGLPAERSYVIPHWCDKFTADSAKYDSKQTVFMWAGDQGKGLGILHAVLRHLRKDEGHDLKLIVYVPEERETYSEMMQEICREEFVDFRGTADNDSVRLAWAQEAHVAGLPFVNYEGCSLQLIEGMMGGCVPVVPSIASVPETVMVNRGTVYQWDPDPTRHALEFATKVNTLLNFRRSSPKDFEKIAMSYHWLAESRYDWPVVSGVWNNFTRSVLDRQP